MTNHANRDVTRDATSGGGRNGSAGDGGPSAAVHATAAQEAFDPRGIRAVAFDGYGTLFDFDLPDFRLAVSQILAEQGIETDHDAFYEAWVQQYGYAGVWGDVWEEHLAQAPSDDAPPHREHMLNGPLPAWHSQWEIWRRQFQRTLDLHSLEGDPDVAADYLRELLSHTPPYPDAHDTIEALAQQDLVLGLLSNADEDFLQSALSRGRLRFSVIQSSESLRAYKPNRAIFSALCRRFGCEPHEVLYVGDSPHADVNGAANAGLRTAWVRRGESIEFPEHVPVPDITVASLDALIDAMGIART